MGQQTGASDHRHEDVNRGATSSDWHTVSGDGPAADPADTPRRGGAGWIWAGLQRFLGFGVMRASSRLRATAPSSGPLYARARLESAKIEEHYSYEQEISQNADSRPLREPTGLIKLILPYDGDSYFTRQAYADVMRGHDRNASPPYYAAIGHLALTGCEHTNLHNLLGIGPIYGSIPVRVPLCLEHGTFAASLLVADSRTYEFRHEYQPDTRHLEVYPVQVDLDLDDPDTAGFSRPQAPQDFGTQRLRIMRHVDFRPGLRIKMTVRLEIPRATADGTHAEVTDIFLNWPAHISLSSLTLEVGGEEQPLHYNPAREGLEWSDVPMSRDPEPASGEMQTFRSPEMCLSVPEPGELYRAEQLTGQAEVKLDRLLSGVQARLYDATGSRRGHPQPELESRICVEFSLILGDAFTRRSRSVFQQFHFDEVIPTEMRVDDIKTALRGLGFTVEDLPSGPESRWLFAQRPEGSDVMRMAVYIAGQHHRAQRERQIPGGITYKTKLDSGELWIYLYGTLPGDSQPVVQQMNALRRALHDRFVRLPARR